MQFQIGILQCIVVQLIGNTVYIVVRYDVQYVDNTLDKFSSHSHAATAINVSKIVNNYCNKVYAVNIIVSHAFLRKIK